MKLNFIRALIIFTLNSVFFYFVFSQFYIKEGIFTDDKKIRLLLFSVLVGIGNILIHFVPTHYEAKKKMKSNNTIKS